MNADPRSPRSAASAAARRSVAALAAGAALAALGLFAPRCSHGGSRRVNVLLISLDSLRPDHLDCYGYRSATGAPTSPNLDQLAKEGVLFEHAVSSTSWTRPSHHAELTGLPDLLHGAAFDENGLTPQHVGLASVLQDAGYATAGFYSGAYLAPRYGFDEGFDDYRNASEADATFDAAAAEIAERLQGDPTLSAQEKQKRLAEQLAARIEEIYHRAESADRVTDAAIHWLEDRRGRVDAPPFFLFAHYFDVHYDYVPPEERYAARFWPGRTRPRLDGDHFFENPEICAEMRPEDLAGVESCYDGEILWVDEQVGRLLKRVDELGLRDDTLVVVTSDHGDEFFEHGEKGHRKNLYGATTDVAFLARLPGRLPENRRIPSRVSLYDVAPTIIELAGVEKQADARTSAIAAASGALKHGMWGRSVLPLITGEEKGDRDCIAFLANRWQHPERPVDSWALWTGSMKVIVSRSYEKSPGPDGAVVLTVKELTGQVFDLATDPGEKVDLADSAAPAVEAAKQRFDATFAPTGALESLVGAFAAGPPPVPLTQIERQKLKAIGYIVSAEPPPRAVEGTRLAQVLPPPSQFPRRR